MDEIRILIAGGGTGGHLFPAIAIGEKIQSIHKNPVIHYMGSTFGIESKVLPVKGLPHTLLPIKGLQRSFAFHSIIKNLSLPYFYFKSTSMAGHIFDAFKPQVVVGTGGYASAIPVKMSLRNDIPVVLQEQNSYPGLTTRMYASQSKVVCTAFLEAHDYLNAECFLSGNPIRKDILQGSKNEGERKFHLNPTKKTLFLMGGSQGSLFLNQLMEKSVKRLQKNNIQVLWQTGDLHYHNYKHLDSETIRVTPFIDAMADAYALCDLIISRSGALAVSEIMAVGKASILIPFSDAAENHQFKNAKALSDQKAAVLMSEKNLDSKNFLKTVIKLVYDNSKLTEMGSRAKSMSKPNATKLIANKIIELATA
ncbi:MAG: undecaprenyldiphospho-muramoylpentapeptide beta-N-acetylglucosaminyltransferase [Candidatus Marinimicrobia bacterium]|jgi:UDP-N-acetylglucosamine--N-acetylmuramyl-(pentapeptide) pyrophosphoryl-undecaprenol N-acetylglucosamine transferase|nr:undecaprenyldiphospho-muramoylpentapeptide beta-N-acetylglucosaminyltransferase [Candidatus Neomarinimicrobiota bacterium]